MDTGIVLKGIIISGVLAVVSIAGVVMTHQQASQKGGTIFALFADCLALIPTVGSALLLLVLLGMTFCEGEVKEEKKDR